MKKIKLEIELTYNDVSIHEDDEEAKDWFYNQVLMHQASADELILHSNFLGDEVGEVRVTKILSEETTQ